MIRKKTILIFFCSFIHFVALSQNIQIRGYITDSITKSPVGQVEILTGDHLAKAVTDENGFFSVLASNLPCELQLRHIAYSINTIIVRDNSHPLFLAVTGKSFDLSPIEISINMPVEVMPDKHYHIMDYEFYAGMMVVLAYENQSFLKPVLLLINFDGDTLSRVEVSKPVK